MSNRGLKTREQLIKKFNNKKKVNEAPFKSMSDLGLKIHPRAYRCFKATRGGCSDD